MVCQGYKAPDVIDPRLLDPKFALEEVDADPQENSGDRVTSLKKLLTVKKNRSGYATEGQQFNECDLMDYLQSQDPHKYLSTMNRFKLDEPAMTAIKDLKPPKDLKLIVEDLKVAGRKEFSDLLKLRYKYDIAI